jgi:hypothetical protein
VVPHWLDEWADLAAGTFAEPVTVLLTAEPQPVASDADATVVTSGDVDATVTVRDATARMVLLEAALDAVEAAAARLPRLPSRRRRPPHRPTSRRSAPTRWRSSRTWRGDDHWPAAAVRGSPLRV